MYKIELRKGFLGDLKKIPKNRHKKINDKIAELEENPFVGKKLSGAMNNIRRLRVGDYRIAYFINEGKCVVLLLKVGHRRDFYEKLRRFYH